MKKILAFAIAAGMLASCSNEDEPQLQADGVALGVSSASLETVVTKTSTTIVTDGATIGVYRLALNGYAQTHAEFYYDATATTPAWTIRNTADNIYLNNNDATVCACAPYISTNTNPAALPITTQIYSAAQDLSYSSLLTANNASNTVSFPDMTHAYAVITLALEKDETYTGAGLVTSIGMKGTDIYQEATLDITSATPAYTNGVSNTTLTFAGLSLTALAEGTIPATSQSFLVIPVATLTASAMKFDFTIDSKAMQCEIIPTLAPFADLTELRPGYNYKVTVIINGTALKVTSVSITDWNDQTVTNPLKPSPLAS